MQARRQARIIALQVLYEMDCTTHSLDEVLAKRLEENPLTEDLEVFLMQLITGVQTHAGELDNLIHHYAPEWPVNQMAIIDRNILRIAIFEVSFFKETPTKVAINEAVEIAKMYASDNAPRFVNGVLGTLVANQANTGEVIPPDSEV